MILITTYAFWLLFGVALLLSELFIPGLIAGFFGIGALVVGTLTLLGVIESLPIQLLVFVVVSLASLFILRKQCHRWLRGAEVDRSAADLENAGFIGARVEVLTDFVQGVGKVELNGAQWEAECDAPLKVGDIAWVVEHKSITLILSPTKP